MDIKQIRKESKENAKRAKENLKRIEQMSEEELDASIKASEMTDEDRQELVNLIIGPGTMSIDIEGDIEKFMDNVRKYGVKGLNMPC